MTASWHLRVTDTAALPAYTAPTAPAGRKIIYIAPLKALVRERVEDWGKGLCRRLGKKLVELTGGRGWGRGVVGLVGLGWWGLVLKALAACFGSGGVELVQVLGVGVGVST